MDSPTIHSWLTVKPKYDSSNRTKRQLTNEVQIEIDRLLELNKEKQKNGLRKQILKKIDILSVVTD